MNKLILISAIFMSLCATTAQAGSLFPPDNIGTNPNIPCPNGTVLKWMGKSVECANPTDGVTVICPKGEFLQGIINGKAVCAAMTACTTTTGGSSASASASASASTSITGSGNISVTNSTNANAQASAYGSTIPSWVQ